jgi:hypothetical protein
MKKIFISQNVLDSMFSEGKAHLDQDRLTMHGKDNEVFKLTPAYKFLYVADGTADPHSLVGKIFTKEQLEKSNMDIYMDSILYHDIPYQVETGYIGIPQNPAAEKKSENMEQVPDEDLLTDYLLKVL